MSAKVAKIASKIPWSLPVRHDAVPEAGLHRELVADETTRAAVAAVAGAQALPRLQASFDLTRQGSGLKLQGEVVATVEQICVVTLEPMTSDVRESIDLVFVPAEAEPFPEPDGISDAIDPDAPDEPELLVNGTVDLGAVATEFLLLAIDPYPRKPDAVFDAPKVPGEDPAANPFAALAKLKPEPPKR
jgi:uncharacterized metal-binding protein YceD (DUF177 family)